MRDQPLGSPLDHAVAGYAHANIPIRLMVWLAQGGVPADRLAQTAGLRIPSEQGSIRRLAAPSHRRALAIKIIPPGSEGVHTATKRSEDVAAGILQYWVVDQDPAQTVTTHRLDGEQHLVRATMPLAWMLNPDPAEHDLG
ncbi:hypothetical protein [Micromonospora lupini]|uniref:Restriction endonuclease domain-containing protein n=1 Tax=Micromonospora lupini str. Lupac 08 TaxID=1150864 RepID=I0L6H6_9ACTN|nr:hypothetical protein [Micromonospora lupini]CCH19423.1 Protein of unknown function [Micromonospora lupini str. Lupac 08]